MLTSGSTSSSGQVAESSLLDKLLLFMSLLELKLIKKIESKIVLIKLLVLVVKAEGEVVEEDVLKDVLLKADVFKVVLLQAWLLEVVLLEALVVKVCLFQAALLVKVVCIEAGFLKALLLLQAKLKGLSQAMAKLKLTKVKAGKRNDGQHAVVQALLGRSPP